MAADLVMGAAFFVPNARAEERQAMIADQPLRSAASEAHEAAIEAEKERPYQKPLGFNIGMDASFVVCTPFGALREPAVKAVINRVPAFGVNPEHWHLELTFDRYSREIDDLFCRLEDGQTPEHYTQSFAVLQTITNPDGTIAQYQFPKMTAFYSGAGSFEWTEKVQQTIVLTGLRRFIVQ